MIYLARYMYNQHFLIEVLPSILYFLSKKNPLLNTNPHIMSHSSGHRIRVICTTPITTTRIWRGYKVVFAALNLTITVGTHLLARRTALRPGRTAVYSSISATAVVPTGNAVLSVFILTINSVIPRHKHTWNFRDTGTVLSGI